jgi:hypothetical protein
MLYAVGTPTNTYVVTALVVAGAKNPPATVVNCVIVLVKRTLPLVRVLVLSGVGTITSTNVVLPPAARADVVVTVRTGNEPEVIVKVASWLATSTRT